MPVSLRIPIWAENSLEAVILVHADPSRGHGSMQPSSSSREEVVWLMNRVSPPFRYYLPKDESTSLCSTVSLPAWATAL